MGGHDTRRVIIGGLPRFRRRPPPSATVAGDWRTHLQPNSRRRIVNKIMDTLKRHLPVSGQEGLNELQKIAVRFEEKIYRAASSQSDYLRRISLTMLTMETKSQNPTMSSSIPSKSQGFSKNLPDSVAKRRLGAKEKPAKAARTLSRTSPGKKVATPMPVKKVVKKATPVKTAKLKTEVSGKENCSKKGKEARK